MFFEDSALNSLANIVLDLDGTIVFPEQAEISIPGRSRPTFIATSTAQWLGRIAQKCNLYLATARNAASVARVVNSLPNVSFAGYVLECGLVSRIDIHATPQPSQDRELLVALLQESLQNWECVAGYEQMVCFIAPSVIDNAPEVVCQLLAQQSLKTAWHVHQERQKTFLYPQILCKAEGLSKLGVSRIDFAAGDDLLYDGSMLAKSVYPLTLPSATEDLIKFVQSRKGFVATSGGHAGALQLLVEIDRHISDKGHFRDSALALDCQV